MKRANVPPQEGYSFGLNARPAEAGRFRGDFFRQTLAKIQKAISMIFRQMLGAPHPLELKFLDIFPASQDW